MSYSLHELLASYHILKLATNIVLYSEWFMTQQNFTCLIR